MLTKNIFRATATDGQYIDNNGDDRSIASINSRLDSIVNLFFFWQRNLSLCSDVCLLLRSLCYTSPLFSIFCVVMGIVVCWMRALFAHFCPSPFTDPPEAFFYTHICIALICACTIVHRLNRLHKPIEMPK